MKFAEKLHVAIPLAIIVVALVAYALNAPLGTLSQVGWSDISLLCPLGALAAMIAAKGIIPRAVVSIALALVLFFVFGRAFCGWVCPVPLVSRLRNLFKRSGSSPNNRVADASDTTPHKSLSFSESDGGANEGCVGRKRGTGLDSRHVILIAALVSTLVFGFPVFCLICPIGLTFATVFAVFALFAHADVTWGVLVAPIVLLVEVVFYRKWCHTFCPLGALMSLVAKLNRTLRPVRDVSKCIEENGGHCGKCHTACREGIDLVHEQSSCAALNECTRCRRCAEACPVKAISFPLLQKFEKGEQTERRDAL